MDEGQESTLPRRIEMKMTQVAVDLESMGVSYSYMELPMHTMKALILVNAENGVHQLKRNGAAPAKLEFEILLICSLHYADGSIAVVDFYLYAYTDLYFYCYLQQKVHNAGLD